jgi:hypothetical protein
MKKLNKSFILFSLNFEKILKLWFQEDKCYKQLITNIWLLLNLKLSKYIDLFLNIILLTNLSSWMMKLIFLRQYFDFSLYLILDNIIFLETMNQKKLKEIELE